MRLNQIGRRLAAALLAACALTPVAMAATKAPANIILMIGDGMGGAEIAAARAYANKQGVPLFLETLPHQSSLIVQAAEEGRPTIGDYVGDSASGGTALASGQRTSVGRIGTVPGGASVPSILELAKARGLRTGVITTAPVTDATPASFLAHIRMRFCETPSRMGAFIPSLPGCEGDRKSAGGKGSIFEQVVDAGADLVVGGGAAMAGQPLDPADASKGTLADYAKAKGVSLVTGPAGWAAAPEKGPVLALLSDKVVPLEWQGPGGRKAEKPKVTDPATGAIEKPVPAACEPNPKRPADMPDLATLTRQAIGRLQKDAGPKGFFLMVEGAAIDKAAHDGDPCGMIGELLAFDRAVQTAVDFAKRQGNTLLIVTADHAQSTQAIPSYLLADLGRPLTVGHVPHRILALRTAEGGSMLVGHGTSADGDQYHTGANVSAFAIGPGADAVAGSFDQTGIFDIMRKHLP